MEKRSEMRICLEQKCDLNINWACMIFAFVFTSQVEDRLALLWVCYLCVDFVWISLRSWTMFLKVVQKPRSQLAFVEVTEVHFPVSTSFTSKKHTLTFFVPFSLHDDFYTQKREEKPTAAADVHNFLIKIIWMSIDWQDANVVQKGCLINQIFVCVFNINCECIFCSFFVTYRIPSTHRTRDGSVQWWVVVL